MGNLYSNILALVTGSIAARLIGILSIPIITRLYSPIDMGVLSAFISLSGVLLAFSSLRYSVVIPLPRTLGYALNSSMLCLVILSVVSSLLFVITYFCYPSIFQLLNLDVLNPYWYLLPISVFLLGLVEILNTWAVRCKEFKLLSKANVLQSFVGTASKILFGLMSIGPIGLIIGQTLVQAGSVITLFKFYLTNYNKKIISTRKMLFIARYYADIPKYRLPSQVLLSLSMNMPILFYASYYGSEDAGKVGLALMVLSLPISLIGNTVGQAFYGEIATIGRKNPIKIEKISRDLLKKLLLVSLLPFILIIVFGEVIFKITFGNEWVDAGKYARIMAIYLVANLASAPLINILNVYARNSFYFWINLSRFLLLIGLFSLSILLGLAIENTLFLYSFLLTAHYFFITYLIFKVLKNEIKKLGEN
ncbi:oligosaccharide flippase family protein [Pseudoalteromonas sp. SR43-7]|uniref:lipopolysaccharide biosynthesis protein n=1 Tax=Pseudoalteromonas sp. SR43-7 TaxID=2760939 RepID=UPI0015FC8B15|nr:oligosaccharide flippase family protein [Pseudoalteromonas sp. SR43-7]MBB1328174.1 oligosaccharide flippase family protein [Pseudoalteromonas sp. SR43-7]